MKKSEPFGFALASHIFGAIMSSVKSSQVVSAVVKIRSWKHIRSHEREVSVELVKKARTAMTSTPTSPEAISSATVSAPAEAGDAVSIVRPNLRRRLEEGNLADEGNGVGGGDSGGGSDGGIPLSGEFFLMFFYVLLVVFAVLFLPVFWKCAKNAVLRRKVGLSNDNEEDCSTERTKEDILTGVEDIKVKIAEESRKVRNGMSNSSSNNNNGDDSVARNEEDNVDDLERISQNDRNNSTRPMSGKFYGTYFYNNKARMTPMDLTFARHPHGGFVILGSGLVQSGRTEISEGYLAPNGEAYFVEVGGINPISVNLDVTDDDLTSRRLAESEVTSLLVLYRGNFDFTQPNIIFKGWRYSSTGITRIYHLLRRPKENKIRHVMSTIGSSIHSARRRRSSTTQQPTDEEETKDEEVGGVLEATA